LINISNVTVSVHKYIKFILIYSVGLGTGPQLENKPWWGKHTFVGGGTKRY